MDIKFTSRSWIVAFSACLGGFGAGWLIAKDSASSPSLMLKFERHGRLLSIEEGFFTEDRWVRNGYSIGIPDFGDSYVQWPVKKFIELADYANDGLNAYGGSYVLLEKIGGELVLTRKEGDVLEDQKSTKSK